MNDVNELPTSMTDIDQELRRTLGTAMLSPEQRTRHREMIVERAERVAERSPVPHRQVWLIPAGVSLSVVLILLAGIWLRDMHMSPVKSQDVAAAVRLLSAPRPGEGRHIVIKGERGFTVPGVASRWTSDIWQRVLVDGTEQLSVQATSDTGAPQGSYVQNGSIYRVIEQDGTVERGSGTPMAVSPAVASALISPDALRDQMLGMLSTGGARQLSQVQNGIDEVTTFDLTSGMFGSTDSLQQEFGITSPIRQGLVEVAVDRASGRLHTYRVTVVDADGKAHLVWAFTFSRWDDLPASDVDPARFDISAIATPNSTRP